MNRFKYTAGWKRRKLFLPGHKVRLTERGRLEKQSRLLQDEQWAKDHGGKHAWLPWPDTATLYDYENMPHKTKGVFFVAIEDGARGYQELSDILLLSYYEQV